MIAFACGWQRQDCPARCSGEPLQISQCAPAPDDLRPPLWLFGLRRRQLVIGIPGIDPLTTSSCGTPGAPEFASSSAALMLATCQAFVDVG